MRFFSKITVLFNISFLVYVVLWYIEMNKHKEGISDQILPLPWLQNTLVVLGYTSVIVNVLFLIVYFIFASLNVVTKIPRWIIIFNIVLFGCQVFFHFILK